MNLEPENAADRLRDLVADALDLPEPGRAAFLAAAGGADAALLAEAQSLLGHGPAAGPFLETPAYALAGGDDLAAAGELRPGDRLGDCQVLGLLGKGGMGEVYLAHDTRRARRRSSSWRLSATRWIEGIGSGVIKGIAGGRLPPRSRKRV